jgi:hypothetical protein
MQPPISESFSTLVDSKGKNRIIIDTDAHPWTTIGNELATNAIQQIEKTMSLFSQRTDSDETFMLFYGLTFPVPEIFEVDVDGDETIEVLWKKVHQIEMYIVAFLRFMHVIQNKDLNVSFSPYIDLACIVRNHTRGHIYKMANLVVNGAATVKITDAPRGWCCPICCEVRGMSHMCHSFSCGHQVHYGCMIEMMSSECPICRALD